MKGIQDEWMGVEKGISDEDQGGEAVGGAGEGEGQVASGRVSLPPIL